MDYEITNFDSSHGLRYLLVESQLKNTQYNVLEARASVGAW